jgi:hypothetical protein
MAGMGTPCVVCGMVPTRTMPIRRGVGLLVLMRCVTITKPLCKHHGRQIARQYLTKTLMFGWWSVVGLFVNVFMIVSDLKALSAYRDLPDPAQPGSVEAMAKALRENIQVVTPQGEWHPDPYVRHQYRWLIGTTWTDQVCDDGQLFVDPPGWKTSVTS